MINKFKYFFYLAISKFLSSNYMNETDTLLKKLAYLRKAHAIAASATQKFELIENIEEIEKRLKEIREEETSNFVSSNIINENYDDILIYVKEISETVDKILFSNQEGLLSYMLQHIQEHIHAKISRHNIDELYNLQTYRSCFGKWISYLQNEESELQNKDVKKNIQQLIIILEEIKDVLYSVENSAKDYSQYSVERYPHKSTLLTIHKQSNEIAHKVIHLYLENLRSKAEKIGSIHGNILFLAKKKL